MEANENLAKTGDFTSKEGAHILVFRLSAMGDVAMTVPVIDSLTQSHPTLRVTVLTKALFKPMFSSLTNVTVHTADVTGKHKGVIGLWRLFRELNKETPNAVADLHNVLRSKVLRFFFSFTSSSIASIDKGRAAKKALTAKKNKSFRPLQSTHSRYAEVFQKLGFNLQLGDTVFQPKRALVDEVKQLLGTKDSTWLGIAPFAAFKGKMYPLEKMREVIEHFNTEKYKLILFGGGPTECAQLMEFEQQFENVVCAAGRLKFEEELALISHLDLMLSMDSGNGHLAAMFGVPTVTLWGVTHPYAGFYPYGQHQNNAVLANREKFPMIPTSVYGNKFPKGYERAIATIAPEAIILKIEEVLLR